MDRRHLIMLMTTLPLSAVPHSCSRCADGGWVCEQHDEKPMGHDGCGAPGMPCMSPACQHGRAALNQRVSDDSLDRVA